MFTMLDTPVAVFLFYSFPVTDMGLFRDKKEKDILCSDRQLCGKTPKLTFTLLTVPSIL